eukprot:3254074-Rhodomonas_salina.1
MDGAGVPDEHVTSLGPELDHVVLVLRKVSVLKRHKHLVLSDVPGAGTSRGQRHIRQMTRWKGGESPEEVGLRDTAGLGARWYGHELRRLGRDSGRLAG